jgi:hypothetical protein
MSLISGVGTVHRKDFESKRVEPLAHGTTKHSR